MQLCPAKDPDNCDSMLNPLRSFGDVDKAGSEWGRGGGAIVWHSGRAIRAIFFDLLSYENARSREIETFLKTERAIQYVYYFVCQMNESSFDNP